MAARKVTVSRREKQLERELSEMRGQLQALMSISGTQKHTIVSGKPMVGIRNVSSYTIGLYNNIQGEQGEITLHPEPFGGHDPSSVAVISHQFWTTIRKGKLIEKGLIVRDDSIVGSESNVGPEDRPEDLAQGVEKNLVPDPFIWIESREDSALREDVARMTSEPSLRRLAAAVDHKIWSIGEERYKDHPERAKMAIRECPSKYHFVDQLVEERLIELDPLARDVSDETQVKATFRN